MNTRTVSWKLFHTTLGACASMALGAAMGLFAHTLMVALPGLIVGVGIYALAARAVAHRAKVFKAYTFSQKNNVILFATAAAAANAVFDLAWTVMPQAFPLWILCIGALALAEYWVCKFYEWCLENPREAHAEPQVSREERQIRREQARTRASRPPEELKLLKALRKAQHEWLSLRSWTPVGGDDSFGVKYTVRVPSAQVLAAKENKTNGGHAIGPAFAEALAIAMSEVFEEAAKAAEAAGYPPQEAVELESDWVSVQKEPGAGIYSITINTVDVLNRLYLFRDTERDAASIYEPARVGFGLDGLPYFLSLAQHGNCIGRTQSGKSSLINVIIAYLTRCEDAVLWVCGTHKLYESIGNWIEPYRGTGIKPPFDWVAYGAKDTAEMLAAAMMVSDWRYNLRMDDPRRDATKAIVVLLDEASFALNVQSIYTEYQGQWKSPADLAADIIKATASAGIYLILASQRGTHDNWGKRGGDVNANMGYTFAFASRDFQEIGRQMGDYKLAQPRRKGENWLNPGTGDLPVHLKAEYVREWNPKKRAEELLRLHGIDPEGVPTERDIAWDRRRFDHTLDPGSQAAAGEAYADRCTDPDDILNYLNNVLTAAAQETKDVGPYADGVAIAEKWLKAALGDPYEEPSADERDQGADVTEPAQQRASVSYMSGKRSVKDYVRDVLAAAEEPLGPLAIRDRVIAAGGPEVKEQRITNTLNELRKDEEVTREGHGQWVLAANRQGANA